MATERGTWTAAETDSGDNLRTIRLVDASYESARSGRAMEVGPAS